MHFTAFFLALLPAAAVRALTLFSDFDCTPASGTIVGCDMNTCQSFDGKHSFQNNEVVIPQFVQTYETANCVSPAGVAPVNFTAAPRSCVAAITARPIGSFKCSLQSFTA